MRRDSLNTNGTVVWIKSIILFINDLGNMLGAIDSLPDGSPCWFGCVKPVQELNINAGQPSKHSIKVKQVFNKVTFMDRDVTPT